MKALHRSFSCIKKITGGSPWEKMALIIHAHIKQHFEMFLSFFPFCVLFLIFTFLYFVFYFFLFEERREYFNLF